MKIMLKTNLVKVFFVPNKSSRLVRIFDAIRTVRKSETCIYAVTLTQV
jgi:hypothetical protein